MKSYFNLSNIVILFLIAGAMSFPFLGEINLFDWDETMIASVSKEMYLRNEVLEPYLNGSYFLEKPPFFFWTQLISFKYLGVNEYAARFPNAVCLLFVVLTLYRNGQRMYSATFGMMWAMIYLSMLLAQLYHKSGLVEPWFYFFIYLALYNFARVIEMRQERGEGYYRSKDILVGVFYASFATAGAMLTKGIEGLIIILLSYWLLFILSSAKYGIGISNFFKWLVLTFVFILIWVGVEYKWHGTGYLKAFYQFQLSELDIEKASWTRKMTIPIVVLLVGCFPASVIAMNSMGYKSYESTIQKVFRLMMVSSLIVLMLMITVVKNKMIHYASYTYYPISFLAAYSVRYIFEEDKKITKLTWLFLILIGLTWSVLLILIPATRANIDILHQYIQDDTLNAALSIVYPWQEYEIYLGMGYFMILIFAFLFLYKKYYRTGLIILFFSAMIFSEIILLYYVPKMEQLTQGPQVDFIKQNQDVHAVYYYQNGKSYLPHFYLNHPYIQPENMSLEELSHQKTRDIPVYIIRKKNDTIENAKFQKITKHLYSQGIYSFYKLK